MGDPATDTTAPGNQPQSWGQPPNYRGTFDIIWLCFSTLIICTWNTVHFNIPLRRYSDARRLFLQVSWMVIALYAPELLLFLAINERIRACTMVNEVLAVHPHLTGLGLLKRTWKSIWGPLKRKFVSA